MPKNLEESAVPISDDDKVALVLHNQLLFALLFFGDELTIPPERTDLPEKWQGQQIMSEKQRIMFCDRSRQIAFRMSRKTGKTIVLCAAFFRWSLWHVGRAPTDGLLHCPREHHLTNIRLRIEKKIMYTRLFQLLVTRMDRSKGFMETNTGITWFLRIEGRTGTGESMVGPAASYELGDEQDYANWGGFNERQQAILPRSMRMLAGVPRGVQGGPFWSVANKKDYGEGWSVFTGKDGYNAFINPIYLSEQARRRLEVDSGGTETQSYQTQILGLDGARVFSSFPFIPLVASADFVRIQTSGDEIDRGGLGAELTRIPQIPADIYMLAGDLGRSPSPTEIGYWRFFQGAWIETARLHITVADSFQTSQAIHELDCALPHPASVIVIDAHGQGTGIFDQMHKNEKWLDRHYAQRVIDAAFNNFVYDERRMVHSLCKQLVRTTSQGWYCDTCGIPVFHPQDLEPQRVATKQWAFEALKDHLSAGQRWLTDQVQKMDYTPIVLHVLDEDLWRCLEGTTEMETSTGHVKFDAPSRHLVDMMLCAVIGVDKLSAIEHQETSPSWLDEVGWVPGNSMALPWEAAYEFAR